MNELETIIIEKNTEIAMLKAKVLDQEKQLNELADANYQMAMSTCETCLSKIKEKYTEAKIFSGDLTNKQIEQLETSITDKSILDKVIESTRKVIFSSQNIQTCPGLEQNLLEQISLHKKQSKNLREEIKCLYEAIGTYQLELEGLKNIKMDKMKTLNAFACTDCNFSRDTDINGNVMRDEIFCTKSARCETMNYCCNRFENKRY